MHAEEAVKDVGFGGDRINFGGRGQYLKWGGYKGSWGPHLKSTPSLMSLRGFDNLKCVAVTSGGETKSVRLTL